MTGFPFLAQRLFNTPLIIRPEKAEVVVAALAERLGITRLARANGEFAALDEFDHGAPGGEVGYVVMDGIAVVPVAGTLVQRCGSLRPYSGMTGYNAIGHNVMTALADDRVKAVLLDVDSPGGEVAGCFDLCDAIYDARGKKPIWAALNESGYSAAYALAAACDRITIPRTGGAGSIGVVCMHVDWSRAIDDSGLTVTFIQDGDRKTDGAPEKPLSAEALADIQDKVSRCASLFRGSVARYRGVPEAKIRDQQAGTFMGADAVTQFLADAVMPIDEAFAELRESVA